MNQAQLPLLLTTAIPYVNAAPHIGHALELLLGDALARHARQRGRRVRFTGGTDDHSTKNARAAEALGVETRQLVTEHGDAFRRLPTALGVHLDDYVHTSRDVRHAPSVVALWERCLRSGDLYQSDYRGLYCVGCEAYLAETELDEGRCPTHHERPDLVAETNWFFRLSRYQQPLLAALESDELRIEPPERRSEVLSFVRAGLSDFSVSRSRARARSWGIPVPGDPTQVIYVWFDALANYLSGLGFPERSAPFELFWGGPGAREHLLGKDVLRFHAVYWPAILLSAALPLPTAIRAHGFVTSEGVKIGKSLGNTVDPFELVERFGVSPVRFYFLRHLHSTKDSDFQLTRLAQANDVELAGKLGNLLQRTTALALRHPGLVLRPSALATAEADGTLLEAARSTREAVLRSCDDFALHRALEAVVELVAAANRYADARQPWSISKRVSSAQAPSEVAVSSVQLSHVLWHLCEALRIVAVLIAPFLPDAAPRLLARLGVPEAQQESLDYAELRREQVFAPEDGPPLFPRREVTPHEPRG